VLTAVIGDYTVVARYIKLSAVTFYFSLFFLLSVKQAAGRLFILPPSIFIHTFIVAMFIRVAFVASLLLLLVGQVLSLPLPTQVSLRLLTMD
jgi:hypothetical protein